MSISSRYSEEERKNLDKYEYMRNATYEDILQYNDIVFNVAALIRESTDSVEQKRAYEVQKNMVLVHRKISF